MRFPGIASVLASILLLSCSVDQPDEDTSQLASFSKSSARHGSQSLFRGQNQRRQPGQQLGFGQLSMTLLHGAIQPTFCDTMTFDRDAFGVHIPAGADVSLAYEDAGITMSALDRNTFAPGRAIAFDSSHPTGGDFDLGTPSERHGGPGRGCGGASNRRALGNLAIKAENTIDLDMDGNVDDPDDDAGGAWFVFDFDQNKCVSRADLVDIEDNERPARFRFYDDQYEFISEREAGGLGDNSVEHAALGVCGVRRLKVGFRSSGALNDVVVCNAPEPQTDLQVDVDLDNIVEIEFDLALYLKSGPSSSLVSRTRTSIDPLRAIRGGALLPVPIASNVTVSAGKWRSVRFELTNVEAVGHDGSRMPVAGMITKEVQHAFEIHDCGSSHLTADWNITARIEGDLLGIGLGLSFSDVDDGFDPTGCPP